MRRLRVRLNRVGGFTLVELLVVVLIIGILAFLGLPRYQKAVESSKANVAVGVVSSIAAANRKWLIDHDGGLTSGPLVDGCGNFCCPGSPGCTPRPPSSCFLIACGYIPQQNFDNDSWTFYSGNPADGPVSPCNEVPPSNWVACAHRRVCGTDAPPCADPSQPWAGWVYLVDINGGVTAGGGAPAAPK